LAVSEIERRGERQLAVIDARRGQLRSRAHLGAARLVAIAEHRGLALIADDAQLTALDLGGGRVCAVKRCPQVRAVAIDAAGDVIVALARGGGLERIALHDEPHAAADDDAAVDADDADNADDADDDADDADDDDDDDAADDADDA